MTKVSPAPPRATVTEEPGGLRIVIPAWRHWLGIVFLGIWLPAWVVAEVLFGGVLVAALVSLLIGWGEGPTSIGGTLLLAAFLVPWTAAGLCTAVAWLWSVAGKDVVTVTDRGVTLKRDVWGRGPTRTYDVARVRALRVVPWWKYNPWATWGYRRWMFPGGGPIALDHDGRTTRFGSGLHEAEARRIVARIRERLPLPTGPSPDGW